MQCMFSGFHIFIYLSISISTKQSTNLYLSIYLPAHPSIQKSIKRNYNINTPSPCKWIPKPANSNNNNFLYKYKNHTDTTPRYCIGSSHRPMHVKHPSLNTCHLNSLMIAITTKTSMWQLAKERVYWQTMWQWHKTESLQIEDLVYYEQEWQCRVPGAKRMPSGLFNTLATNSDSGVLPVKCQHCVMGANGRAEWTFSQGTYTAKLWYNCNTHWSRQ